MKIDHYGDIYIGIGVSPASNGGCGLKLAQIGHESGRLRFHPPVMAGVD